MKTLTVIYASCWWAAKNMFEILTHPVLLLMATGALLAHMVHVFW